MGVYDIIALTAELCGEPLDETAVATLCIELAVYPDALVFNALRTCRRCGVAPLTLEAIVSRIDSNMDGADAAWAWKKYMTGTGAWH